MIKYVELRVHQAIHVTETGGATQKFGLNAEKQLLIDAKIHKAEGGFFVTIKPGSGYFITDNNVVWARFIEKSEEQFIQSPIAMKIEEEKATEPAKRVRKKSDNI